MCELYHMACGTRLASHDGPMTPGVVLKAKNITLLDGTHPRHGDKAEIACDVCDEMVPFSSEVIEVRDV